MVHRIAVVVGEGVSPFEFAIACEVFGLDRPELGVPWYDFRICSAAGRVATSSGFAIEVPHGLDAVTDADTVLVPTRMDAQAAARDGVIDALRQAHAGGARMVAFCSGVFTLAAAGLLDGRRATTHWLYTGEFRRLFPRVRLDPNVLYVDEGDVLTSAGTAAGIDLALHLVRQDHGADVATMVARRMVVPPHREGGQAQFVVPPAAGPVPDETAIAGLLDDLRSDMDHDLTVADMAGRVAMSPRTFARRFKEATGTTPARWLSRQRVERARQLLECTGLDIEVVARRCGFGTATTLRQHFRRELGTTPTAYRSAFARDRAA